MEEAPSVLSLCLVSTSKLVYDRHEYLGRRRDKYFTQADVWWAWQELLVTFLLVLCLSDKAPITASEDEADTFLETWQPEPAVTVVTKLQQLSHH